MSAMQVEAYTAARRGEWDAFVRGSKNGTFLFERGYMDYHADRFVDASYVVRDGRGAIVALLPANRDGDLLASHGGLTYGGFVVDAGMTTPAMLRVFGAVLARARDDGVRRLRYKAIPHIYHAQPAEEDLYCLFRAGARLYRRDVLSVIDYRAPGPVQDRRARSARRAERAGLVVRETRDFAAFWPVLTANLIARYGVNPVHSLDEIARLADCFPDRIRLFAAYDQSGGLHAGVVVFVTATVCHVQYPGIGEAGKAMGALDAVERHIIDAFAPTVRYFDFGSSTEDDGRRLNEGLAEFKEGFGARTVAHDFYELDVISAAGAFDGI